MAYTPTTFVEGTAPAISAAEMNKIGTGIDDAHALNVDDVTVVDTAAPTGDTVAPKTLFNWFANMIKQITGKSNWRTTPRTTLENAVKLNGDTMTGQLVTKSSTGVVGVTTGNYGLEVKGNGTAGDAAYMAFHRPGLYASFFGLDTDNKWKVGGWSAGAVAYELWHDARMRVHSSGNYLEWNNGGTWYPVGGGLTLGVSSTVQHDFPTQFTQTQSSGQYMLVAKFVPKGTGEIYVEAELQAQTSSNIFAFVSGAQVDPQTSIIPLSGNYWSVPLGTVSGTPNPVYSIGAGTTLQTPTLVSTIYRVWDKIPVYIYCRWETGNSGGFIRNIKVKYDILG